MPNKVLTDISIKALPLPEKGQTTYWDSTRKPAGFGVRVSQGGSKSFVVMFGHRRQLITIGNVNAISLMDARSEAKRIVAEHTLGKLHEKSIPFDDAKHLYLEHIEAKNKERTHRDYTRLLNRHFKFGRTPVDEISRAEVMRKVNKLKNTPAEQTYAFRVIRAFFKWCVKEGYIAHTVLDGVGEPASRASRERSLSRDELIEVYQKALAFGYPFGHIVALCILTGQRRSEIARLEWDWIDGDTITLPASVTKNNRIHSFPISGVAQNIITSITPTSQQYLFPAGRSHVRGNPTTVFNGWGKCKTSFDNTLVGVEPWTLHDLRRTCATTLAELGTPLHVTEKLLNHVSGSLGSIVGVYNRYQYMEEMRTAVGAYNNLFALC